jgi:hypothetical protein
MRNPITKPYRIVCEGAADASFFRAIFRCHNLDLFEADCAHKDKPDSDQSEDRCGGKSAVTDELRALKGFSDTHPDVLRGVIVAIDSDADGNTAFDETIKSIKAVKLQLPVPTRLLELKKGGEGEFGIAVMCIPWIDQPGCLDTLLFESVRSSHSDLMIPIDDFCSATQHRNGDWTINPRSKMRLRLAIAASYKQGPDKALGFLLNSSENPFNLNDPAFMKIVEFLRTFS